MTRTHISGRRHFVKTAAAFVAATAAPEFISVAAAQTGESRIVVFSDTHAAVETAGGRVRGYTERGILTFKGIPYGAPPVGDLRFMRSEKPKPWAGVRNSLQYGPACPQPGARFDDLNQFFFEYDRRLMDEDCLRLNIWTPAVGAGKRPVMLWLHGGGFGSGSSSELPSYDGHNLAARGDVVVVSINHRLNAFGFLYLTEYGNRYADSVNVGMTDIVLALEWVRDNIERFGGDSGNVTIFGQSGGGAKVNFLMAMPSARGLFHKAIAQSATPSISNKRSAAFSSRHTAAVLTALGLGRSTLDRLRQIPYEALRRAYFETYAQVELEHDASTRFASRISSDNVGPIADGRVILPELFSATAPGISAQVPMLIGHTLNEGGGPNFFSTAREEWTTDDVLTELAKEPMPFPEALIDALRSAYPGVRPVEIYAHTRNTGGLQYRTDTLSQAFSKTAQHAAPAFVYSFAWKTRVLDGRPRAFHRSELPFVFDNTDRCAHQTGGTAEARALAAKVSEAWIAFARSGDPNHPGIPRWPPFTSGAIPTMFFDNMCEVRYDHDREARRVFEEASRAANRSMVML